MNPFRFSRGVFRLFAYFLGEFKTFFIRWFLPVPAVEKLDDNHWTDDDQPQVHTENPEPHHNELPPGATPAPEPQPAPEIRPPEGDEDRQARTPKVPNPFA